MSQQAGMSVHIIRLADTKVDARGPSCLTLTEVCTRERGTPEATSGKRWTIATSTMRHPEMWYASWLIGRGANSPIKFCNDPRIARADFGALMHAVEDFYSHSNWLETGQRNLAPIIPACAGLGLLGTLQTGFFRPDLYDPISGCPMDASGNPAPPAPSCTAI